VTVTATTQLGLLEPSAVSQVPPEVVVPGQEVETFKFDGASPAGSEFFTKLEMSVLEAVQSKPLELHDALFQLDPRTLP